MHESQIKCANKISMHRERIKLIGEGNKYAVCPTRDELETWDHDVLCDKLKCKRDARVKKIEKSFNDAAKKVKESAYEIDMVKRMVNEIVKYFNKEIF